MSGDGSDKVVDNEGANRIIWIDANKTPHIMKTFYKSGDAEWKSPDGTAEVNKNHLIKSYCLMAVPLNLEKTLVASELTY